MPVPRSEGHSNRSLRSSTLSLSSHDHKVSIDCLYPDYHATTVHQDGDQLQFFNPHPDNEIQYHGYASSRRATSSHVNVVNDLSATRGQETVESEAGENEAGESEAVESEVVESEVDESETGESETVHRERSHRQRDCRKREYRK